MPELNINEIIDKLLIIQERDVRIMQCEREINQIPKQKKEVENDVNIIQDQQKKAADNFKLRQAEIKRIELEIDALRQKVARLREQQLQIKSNDEFKALNNEIGQINEEIKKMEDQEILAMEKAEEDRRQEIQAQHDLADLGKTIEQRLSALKQRQFNLETELEQVKTDRENIAKDIAKEVLAIYNKIMENKKDKALVTVTNGTCAGCHMNLPAHVVCDLKKKTSLLTCPFCGRILYLPA